MYLAQKHYVIGPMKFPQSSGNRRGNVFSHNRMLCSLSNFAVSAADTGILNYSLHRQPALVFKQLVRFAELRFVFTFVDMNIRGTGQFISIRDFYASIEYDCVTFVP